MEIAIVFGLNIPPSQVASWLRTLGVDTAAADGVNTGCVLQEHQGNYVIHCDSLAFETCGGDEGQCLLRAASAFCATGAVCMSEVGDGVVVLAYESGVRVREYGGRDGEPTDDDGEWPPLDRHLTDSETCDDAYSLMFAGVRSFVEWLTDDYAGTIPDTDGTAILRCNRVSRESLG